jgi:hypothetical protein
MVVQTTVVARQWLSSDHVGTPRDMNATIAQQQRNGVFCAVRAEMLKAGQVRSWRESAGWWVSELYNRCGSVVVSSCYENLVAETRGQFRNPEDGESPPLETATKQRLVKTVTDWEDIVCPIVMCEVCRTVTAKTLLVVTSCKSSINPITSPKHAYSHSMRWQYYLKKKNTIIFLHFLPNYNRSKSHDLYS